MSLTKTEYDAKLAAQGGKCGACGVTETITNAAGIPMTMQFDTTGQMVITDEAKAKLTLGLLCWACNGAAASLNYDPARALGLSKYLDKVQKAKP
jgi:hypothetical protein